MSRRDKDSLMVEVRNLVERPRKAKQRNRPVKQSDLIDINAAIFHLHEAREQLRRAGAGNAANYVSRALKSTYGARNNAERMFQRQLREARS